MGENVDEYRPEPAAQVARRIPYLAGQRWRRKRYHAYSPEWQHDHCAVCFAKFAEWDGADILHEGLATTEQYEQGADYDWVCERCFAAYRDIMNWSETDGPDGGTQDRPDS